MDIDTYLRHLDEEQVQLSDEEWGPYFRPDGVVRAFADLQRVLPSMELQWRKNDWFLLLPSGTVSVGGIFGSNPQNSNLYYVLERLGTLPPAWFREKYPLDRFLDLDWLSV